MVLSTLPMRLLDPVRRRATPAVMSLLDQGLVSGFGFLTGIATARLVGIDHFGRFTLVLIFISFAQGVHNALVTAPMMTLVGSRTRSPRAYFAAFVAASVVMSLAAGIIVSGLLGLLFAARGEQLSFEFLAAAAMIGAAQNFQFTIRRLLFACAKGGQAIVMDAARAIVCPLAIVAIMLTGSRLSVVEIMWILAGSAFVTSLPFALPLVSGSRRALHLGTVGQRHWPIARWLLPVVLVTFGQEQLVWILAGAFLGDSAVGGLRASQYIIGLVLLMLTATENIVPVGAARAYAIGNRAGLNRYLLSTGTKLGLLIAVPLLAIAIPAELWLKLLFGQAFVPFAGCLRILALAAVFIHIRDMATHVFRATQQTGVIFRAFLVSLVVSLAVLQPLMTHGGLTGAACVVLIGHATSMLYLLLAAANPGWSIGPRMLDALARLVSSRERSMGAPPSNGSV